MKSTILSSKKMIVILAIIMTVILSSCNLQKKEENLISPENPKENESIESKEMMKDDVKVSDNNIMGTGEMMMGGEHNMEMGKEMKKDEMMMKKGEYTAYSPEAVKNAKGKIVLFFHADWCPSCKATDKDILSKKVPDDLTILKADFDKEIELKQKYKVLAQTTFVQIDNDGNEITKWVGGDLEDIISSVK